MTAFTVWFTGLPRCGKSELAVALQSRLHNNAIPSEILRPILVSAGKQIPDYASSMQELITRAIKFSEQYIVTIVAEDFGVKQWREAARNQLKHFLVVEIHSPLRRSTESISDIYVRSVTGEITSYPDDHFMNEKSLNADLIIERADWEIHEALNLICAKLLSLGYLTFSSFESRRFSQRDEVPLAWHLLRYL